MNGAVGRLRWSICAMLFYATTVNDTDRQVLGILSVTLQHFVYNASAIGSIGGGWLPGLLHRHGFSMAKARFSAMLLFACVVVPVLFANRMRSLWSAVALLSIAAAAHQGWSANLLTISSNLVPNPAVASVVGIGGTAGSVGGVLFAIATEWILQATHSYTVLFSLAGTAYLVAMLFLFLIVPGLAPIQDRA